MVLKLIYFGAVGRGETTRIIFTIGKVPFEDFIVERPAWPELKATLPLGQVPVLQLEDGRILGESGAIERYAAKLAGLYPKDPVTAAFADQWHLHMTDLFHLILPTFFMADVDAKIKARQELFAGKVGEKMRQLDKAVEHSPFFAGNELSFADIAIFVGLGQLKSGDMDGIPKNMLDEFPSLKAWFNRIANIDAIKAKYADATGNRLTFKPE